MVDVLHYLTLTMFISVLHSSQPDPTLLSSGDSLKGGMEISTLPQTCPLGCFTCSKWNGCLTCSKDFVWQLEKVFLRRIGVCRRDCPIGYFKQAFLHAPEHVRCTECEPMGCAHCSQRDFCDKCQEPYLEYRGTCILECPSNLYHSHYRRDCFEQVDCLVESWSSWSDCLREGKACGYKWGNRTRSRVVLQHPSPNGNACPQITETQRCKLEERYCNSVQPASGDVTKRRHTRQKERRKRRCRQLKRSGKLCKEENYIEDMVSYPPPFSDKTDHSYNVSSYYDYYRRGAQLLKLLNLKRGLRGNRNEEEEPG
ncbi:R-spondin-3-like [Watersipora subatra]|uniref:R-spondin-3-like n=1 Tax=Watersipora subatra TaxID=2589382 RepID=UPI00355C8EF5